jgi:hypothetical protein
MSDYKIHTILIDAQLNKLSDAIEWVVSHGYELNKVDVLPNGEYYRFRQESPNSLKSSGYTEYRTIQLDPIANIKLVLAYKGLK